jgi:hypothetical protein
VSGGKSVRVRVRVRVGVWQRGRVCVGGGALWTKLLNFFPFGLPTYRA